MNAGAMPGYLRYSGLNRKGAHVTGTVVRGGGAAFVERCYRSRWRELELWSGEAEVGGIYLTPTGAIGAGERMVRARTTWWVEADA